MLIFCFYQEEEKRRKQEKMKGGKREIGISTLFLVQETLFKETSSKLHLPVKTV